MTMAQKTVLILGSAPNAPACAALPKSKFSAIVAINNAWSVRDDWEYHIAPDDFPAQRRPQAIAPGQTLVGPADYVPANNQYGGIVYAGATMAFTAGYWALAALRPTTLVYFGCDMVYPARGNAHFYGTGAAAPLRDDSTLRSLEAKSARLMYHAANQGCACVRAPVGDSRLVFPAISVEDIGKRRLPPVVPDADAFQRVRDYEEKLGYFVESGRYWEAETRFCADHLDAIARMWMASDPCGSRPWATPVS